MITRQELIESRKKHAGFMQSSAQALEHGTIGIKTICALEAVTDTERALLEKAEAMGLKAANITRRIANRMEQLK